MILQKTPLELLMASRWGLTLEDIARVLELDEHHAAIVLRTLRDAGAVRLCGCRWEFIR